MDKRRRMKLLSLVVALLAVLFVGAVPVSAGYVFAASDDVNGGYVQKYSINSTTGAGTLVNTYNVGGVPHGLAANSTDLWIAMATQDQILHYSNGVNVGTLFTTPDTDQDISPQSLTLFGGNIISASFAGPIEKFIGGTGSPITLATIPAARGLASDAGFSGGIIVATQDTVKWINASGTVTKTVLDSTILGVYPQDSLRSAICKGDGTCFVVDTAWAFDPGTKEGRIWKFSITSSGDYVAGSAAKIYVGPAGTNGITYDPLADKLYLSQYFAGSTDANIIQMNTDGSGQVTVTAGTPRTATLLYSTGAQADQISASFERLASSVQTPEPGTILLLLAGTAGIMVTRLQKRV